MDKLVVENDCIFSLWPKSGLLNFKTLEKTCGDSPAIGDQTVVVVQEVVTLTASVSPIVYDGERDNEGEVPESEEGERIKEEAKEVQEDKAL